MRLPKAQSPPQKALQGRSTEAELIKLRVSGLDQEPSCAARPVLTTRTALLLVSLFQPHVLVGTIHSYLLGLTVLCLDHCSPVAFAADVSSQPATEQQQAGGQGLESLDAHMQAAAEPVKGASGSSAPTGLEAIEVPPCSSLAPMLPKCLLCTCCLLVGGLFCIMFSCSRCLLRVLCIAPCLLQP